MNEDQSDNQNGPFRDVELWREAKQFQYILIACGMALLALAGWWVVSTV